MGFSQKLAVLRINNKIKEVRLGKPEGRWTPGRPRRKRWVSTRADMDRLGSIEIDGGQFGEATKA